MGTVPFCPLLQCDVQTGSVPVCTSVLHKRGAPDKGDSPFVHVSLRSHAKGTVPYCPEPWLYPQKKTCHAGRSFLGGVFRVCRLWGGLPSPLVFLPERGEETANSSKESDCWLLVKCVSNTRLCRYFRGFVAYCCPS